ncbi:MAG: DEAD/DEAH box helicase domain-containing protein [Parcubacteria group bacterium Gr01-1014_20]|nr:MAG: DEAD/DEAH box helicase domain-containing protein [Parcubacteria group bacterium Gr01-1014_20]
MDTIVFDIETKNFFTDPEVGWNNYEALKISVVGVYSYAQDKYLVFDENEIEKLGELLRGAERLVGFSMNRYDVPVLQAHFLALPVTRDIDLWKMERSDLLDEIEMGTGKRISLSRLAEVNLGEAKKSSGAEAIVMYKEGRIEDLKRYCLEDVRITKELYDLYRKQGYLMVPDRDTGELSRVGYSLSDNQGSLF